MQTFLPYPSYKDSARVLDRQRLGKQRVEGLQLLKGQWPNHPASRMWRGHEGALAAYILVVCSEWMSRGYADTCTEQVCAIVAANPDWTIEPPAWMGDEDFHRAHRSNLVRKMPEHYLPLFEADLPNDLPYIWPTRVA